MTLIFAALLGNFLAWCVHAFTWWLREKCLWLMLLCGTFITALCLPLTYFVCLLVFWIDDENSATQYDYSRWPQLFFVATPYVLCLVIAALQKRFFSENTFAFARAFSALVVEIVLAVFICVYAAFNIYDMRSAFNRIPFMYSFAVTIFILALVRPQVMKVQKWLWWQVRPQRATNE